MPILRGIVAAERPFEIIYRGLLVTEDGTVIAPGYGAFDRLRARLREAMPFASPRQSNLGHISLGRILDPVGCEAFSALKALVADARDMMHGALPVREIKCVHERRWYMEDREIIATFPLGALAHDGGRGAQA